MGNGVNLGNSYNMSIADMCGHKVLGMSGSLTNYIISGDATPVDSFSRKNNKKSNKKIDLSKILKFGVGILAFGSGIALLFGGKIKTEKIKKFFGDSFSNFRKSFSNLKLKEKIDFKKPEFKLKKSKKTKSKKAEKFFMDDVAILPANKRRTAIKTDKMSDVIKNRALKPSNQATVETRLKVEFKPQYQENDYGRETLIDLIKKKIQQNKTQIAKNNIQKTTKKEVKEKAKKGSAFKVQKRLNAPKELLMLEAPKNDVVEEIIPKAKRQPHAPKDFPKTPEVIELEAPKDSLEDVIKEVKSWGEIELNDEKIAETSKEYVEAMQWQPGQKFRIYDPVSKEKLGYRYVMDENLNPQPIMPKQPKAPKKATKKANFDENAFRVEIDMPTREQDNIAIDNIAKLTGLNLDEIKYGFTELRPENINIEDVISEFGS